MGISLASWQKTILFLLSFVIVAFGQPLWSVSLSLLAASLGYALFWLLLLQISSAKERFSLAMGWYAGVQVTQLFWAVSHPYAYIYGVLLFCAWLIGFQFGILAIWIKPKTFQSYSRLFALAGCWVCFEMSRLWILTGIPFNPVGLSMSAAIYPLQLASISGVYGLSFLVILTNLLAVKALLDYKKKPTWTAWIGLALFPFVFGWLHFHGQENVRLKNQNTIQVVLVQPALPIEESMHFQTAEEAIEFVLNEWKQILGTLTKQQNKKIDMIILPEYVVPYGTYHAVYPQTLVNRLISELFPSLPLSFSILQPPYALEIETDEGKEWFVSNAYIMKTLANIFNAHVVVGLEDSSISENSHDKKENYSAAFHFQPGKISEQRYEKQILVPMGEYIPFTWCRDLAARYGISGSFACGKQAQLFKGPIPFGTSICYEEIYGDLMRSNRLKGAELLVNLTNDGWYPQSSLPQQHFDHARLRTVENGIPLIRACNTGVTGAIDSLGQVIATLGDGSLQAQMTPDSLLVEVPTFHYLTLYTQYGDKSILIISLICLLGGGVIPYLRRKL